jgi:hypothetical protein
MDDSGKTNVYGETIFKYGTLNDDGSMTWDSTGYDKEGREIGQNGQMSWYTNED